MLLKNARRRRQSASHAHQSLSLRRFLDTLEPRWFLTGYPAPTLPTIPTGTFTITAAPYNAVGNSTTDNTAAIQATLNAAHTAGGGTVVIPAAAGTYLSGPLTAYSNTNIQINSGATLQLLPYGTYPSYTATDGTTDYVSFITTAQNSHDFEVSGSGTIDGQGTPWWVAFNHNAINRPYALIDYSYTSRIWIKDVHFTNPPNVHLDMGRVTNLTVDHITIATPENVTVNGVSEPAHNTDGIDMSGTNLLVTNSSIACDDDNIAIGGSNAAVANVTITNNTFGTGHGLSFGSYTSGGINGVIVDNCTFTNTVNGLQGKSQRGRGGTIQNVAYSNITLTGVRYPILFNSYYNQKTTDPTTDPAQPVTSTTPIWKNISFTNVTSTSTTSGWGVGQLIGLPEALIQNFTFTNVSLTAKTGMIIDNATNIQFNGTSSITVSSGAKFTNFNAQVSTLFGNFATVTPRTTALASTTLTFNLAVTGLTLADLQLTRDGSAVALTGATLTTSNNIIWTLNNLGNLTNRPGSYQLYVPASTAGVADSSSSSNALIRDITGTWLMNGLVASALDITRLVIDPTTSTLADVFVNNVTTTPTYTVNLSNLTTLALSAPSGNSTFNLDFTRGNPYPTGGISVSGDASLTDTLQITGSTASDAFTVTASQFTRGASTIPFSLIQYLSVATGTFTVNTNLNGLSLTAGANSTIALNVTQRLGTLALSTGSLVKLPIDGTLAIVANALNLSGGTLDISNNSVLIHNASTPTFTPALFTGYNNGLWTGTGIKSSYAATHAAHGIGNLSGAFYSVYSSPTVAGTTVISTDVVLQYTYLGDATLDGKVTSSDYTQVDSGFLFNGTGWFNGDFNYDGVVNYKDYALIDAGFAQQPNNAAAALAVIDAHTATFGTAYVTQLKIAESPTPPPTVIPPPVITPLPTPDLLTRLSRLSRLCTPLAPLLAALSRL